MMTNQLALSGEKIIEKVYPQLERVHTLQMGKGKQA